MTAFDTALVALAQPVEHGLSQKAVELARPFGFPITNSMVVTWIVALGLIVFAQVATRRMAQVPGGAQNFLEWVIESVYGLLEGIIGPHLVQKTFWFFGTIFIFILAANWVGLVPGVGTIGWGHRTADGFVVDQPLFRGANADLNLTLAMALVFFACWIVWALQEVGVRGIVKELFAPKGDTSGVMKLLMIVVFFAAGCLEIVSILFRPVSLSFRLYGNVFAGENMLEDHGDDRSWPWLAAAGAVLFHGAAGGSGAGHGLHAADCGLHAPHLPAPRGAGRARTADESVRRVKTEDRRLRKDKTMTGSFHIGLAALGAAIGVGLIGYGASVAVGRNPGASTKIMVQSILSIAFAEAIVFYALFLVR